MNFLIEKNNIIKELSIKPLYLDIFCLIILLGLNPITYFIQLSPGIFPQDFFAYATMARDIFHNGLLYIPSWGHVDTALVIPPLYPFLIAVGNIFSSETLVIAEIISSISMLIFSVVSFYILRMVTNRLIAVIVTAIIQFNYFYFLIGMMPLTESLFILNIGLTLLIALLLFRNSSKKQMMLSVFLGVSCCLVFFSRQVGGIIFVFIALLFLVQLFLVPASDRKVLVRNFIFFMCGSLLLLAPYTAFLYMQTGKSPLKQKFRRNEYVVKVSDPEILKEKKRERKLPDELLKSLNSQSDHNYGIIYAHRRQMRKLLPDSSEMYDNISFKGQVKNGDKKKTSSHFKKLNVYFKQFYNNILILKSVLGPYIFILFFVTCISSLLKTGGRRNLNLFLLSSFVIMYLLVISFFTDKISRYIYILVPFCIMHISFEVYRYSKLIRGAFKIEWPGFLFLAILFLSILLTTPRFFTELHLNKKYLGIENNDTNYIKKTVNGEPVFSLFALEAYLVGSPYRYLPNDSLEKVVAYGKKTGVRWILIYHGRSTANELKFYTNLGWYSDRLLETNYPGLVKLRFFTEDGSMALFEIL